MDRCAHFCAYPQNTFAPLCRDLLNDERRCSVFQWWANQFLLKGSPQKRWAATAFVTAEGLDDFRQ
jgi:hypothetical protein